MVERRAFTDPFIRGLKPRASTYKLAEHAPKGDGRLIVRVMPNGVKEFFYRYRTSGQDKTLSLGRYDPAGRNGKTLAGIRAGLRTNRNLQRDTGDVKAHLLEQERKDEVERRRGSFAQLLAAYVDSLKAANKPSAKQIEGIFRRNVIKPFPQIANRKASDVEPGDIQQILARMVKAGITRQVNVTRAYLRAAFSFGMGADHDPRTLASEGALFGLKGIPVLGKPIKEYENTRERTLDPDELRAYWKALEVLPVAQRATLRFNLALACQRGTQLLRASWSDFNFTDTTLLLRDTKGRGGSRDHLLPLTSFALEQLKPLRELNEKKARPGEPSPPPFSADGKRRIVVNTISHAVRDISKSLKKKQGIPVFQARDLRRTAETMLQELGIDREHRAHLLSHGRTRGVQGKHYERYDFLDEKRVALEKWAHHLQRIIDAKQSAKVIELATRGGGRHGT